MADAQTAIFSGAETLAPQREGINSMSSLYQTAEAFRRHMEEKGFSPHTVKAFNGDLRLVQSFLGADISVSELGTDELNRFLYWLQYERGVSCSSKSYARRVTTLKSFFGWLTSIHVTPFDPAAKLIHQKITTPLPTILQDAEVDRLLAVTEAHLQSKRPDPRPHLLASLLLQTGIKKAECMRLAGEDFEDSDPEHPTVLIRYHDPRLIHKERRLPVSPELRDILRQYVAAYRPKERIFECTPRNLEYVLTDVANDANLPNGASFEMLRWTSAFRDYRDGMSHHKLQDKLGLSKVTFRETVKKLEKIAQSKKE